MNWLRQVWYQVEWKSMLWATDDQEYVELEAKIRPLGILLKIICLEDTFFI